MGPMVSMVRRLFWLGFRLGLVGAVGYAGWSLWQRQQAQTPAAPPEWPPVPLRDRSWAEPIEGACPPGFPVKANDKSGIYHRPGGRFYERTVPERCYTDAAAAEADGYRASKA